MSSSLERTPAFLKQDLLSSLLRAKIAYYSQLISSSKSDFLASLRIDQNSRLTSVLSDHNSEGFLGQLLVLTEQILSTVSGILLDILPNALLILEIILQSKFPFL